MGCRKNLTRLTVAERQAFTNAVNQLRANGDYSSYVRQHEGAMGHGHVGPAFFPWHREYLLRLEQDLQAIDPGVSLPYWDWTEANLNAAGTESLIWRDDLMGGPGQAGTGQVTTGPFAAWGLIRSAFNIFAFPGTGGTIASFMASPNYTTFRQVESPHGAAHVWIGGFVGNAIIAPRDPVFWLIHANVDRLWSEWINRHSLAPGFQPFLPLTGGPQGHNLNDFMWPWNGSTLPFGLLPWTVTPEQVQPADLLDHRALGYFYDTIDPECRPQPPKLRIKELMDRDPKQFIKDRLPREVIKERFPKELIAKELGPKEFKELTPKELTPKELGPKEFKELSPKEAGPKEFKEIREFPGGDPFIRPELRPDLRGAALNFEPDLNPEMAAFGNALLSRRNDLTGRP